MAINLNDMQKEMLPKNVISSGEGKKFNLLGHSITAVFTQQNTDGHYYVFEVISPPGFGLPPHIHEREDELIYVVEGELEILLGKNKFVAKAGDHVFFPKHIVHSFQNAGSKAARAIFTVVPGGNFEEFFDKLAALPPGPPNMEKLSAYLVSTAWKLLCRKRYNTISG